MAVSDQLTKLSDDIREAITYKGDAFLACEEKGVNMDNAAFSDLGNKIREIAGGGTINLPEYLKQKLEDKLAELGPEYIHGWIIAIEVDQNDGMYLTNSIDNTATGNRMFRVVNLEVGSGVRDGIGNVYYNDGGSYIGITGGGHSHTFDTSKDLVIDTIEGTKTYRWMMGVSTEGNFCACIYQIFNKEFNYVICKNMQFTTTDQLFNNNRRLQYVDFYDGSRFGIRNDTKQFFNTNSGFQGCMLLKTAKGVSFEHCQPWYGWLPDQIENADFLYCNIAVNLSSRPNASVRLVESLFNSLDEATTTTVLTISTRLQPYLSDAVIAIATNKNYTVTFA